MPLLYEVKCAQCNDRSPIFSDQYATFLQDDGEEITLPHPGEEGVLKRLGWSFNRAAAQNRLKVYSASSCQSCGSICYRGDDEAVGNCEKCGGSELTEVDSDALLICPSCKQRSGRVRVAGLS